MNTRGHIRYRLADETIVPSVTTIVGMRAKPQLIRWANQLGLDGIDSMKYVDDAGQTGTLAHQLIIDSLQQKETYLRDYSENQINLSESCFSRYEDWARQHTVEPILTETPLVSEKHRFGGTLDLYSLIDEAKVLIDIKTGTHVWDDNRVQVSALHQLLQESGHPVDEVRILHIPRRDPESFSEIVVSPSALTLNFEIFLCLLKVYECEKKLRI